MADSTAPHPADLSAARRAPRITESVVLRALPAAARYILRGAPATLAHAGEAIGVAISPLACRAATGGSRAALWLGPDEQLLLDADGVAGAVEAVLAEALRDIPHSLVDVSHRQTALQVAGPHALRVLSVGCPLDLHEAAFPVHMCTRTVLSKAEVVLWRTGADIFHIEVWRSFAPYVSQLLAEAARELAASA